MIAVDTSVLVRVLADDDEVQAARARELFDSAAAIWLSSIVLVETWWVLKRHYRIAAEEIAGAFDLLIDSESIVTENPAAVRAALIATRKGADFSDALIAASARTAGASATFTFDNGAIMNAGMEAF